jgi:hypothetical protein
MPALRKLYFVDSNIVHSTKYGLSLVVAAKKQKEAIGLFKKEVKRSGMVGKICTSRNYIIIEYIGQALPKQLSGIIRQRLFQ